MGIPKTAAGIFAGSLAVDAFKAEAHASTAKQKLLLKAAGSLAAATSLQLIKDEVIDTIEEVANARNRIGLKKALPE